MHCYASLSPFFKLLCRATDVIPGGFGADKYVPLDLDLGVTIYCPQCNAHYLPLI